MIMDFLKPKWKLAKLNKQFGHMDKKGQLISNTIQGIGGLVISTIIILVIVATLFNANLLTTGSLEDNATIDMRANFTEGIGNVSEKLPTILLIAAVVLLISILVLLFRNAAPIIGGGRSSL
jgi:hypothetical protein